MRAGFEVLNDANTILVDENWANYALVSVQTIMSVANPTWPGPPMNFGAVHSGSTDAELVFVYCDSGFYMTGPCYLNGTRLMPVGTTQAGVAVTFYVFRKQPPVSSNFGLQVFGADSGLLFDAVSKFAKMRATLQTENNNLAQIATIPVGNTPRPAIMMPSWTGQMIQQDVGSGGPGGGMAWRYISLNGPRFTCVPNGIAIQGYSVFAVAQIPIATPTPGVIVTNTNGGPILVIDVTGF